jgi:serine/threonine protein kinase
MCLSCSKREGKLTLDQPALVMELAPDDGLATRLKRGDYKGKDKEEAFKDVGKQVLEGVAYMHSKTIAHRDLWEDNIAFKGDEVRIIDFDYACKGGGCVETVPGGQRGTAAPGE